LLYLQAKLFLETKNSRKKHPQKKNGCKQTEEESTIKCPLLVFQAFTQIPMQVIPFFPEYMLPLFFTAEI